MADFTLPITCPLGCPEPVRFVRSVGLRDGEVSIAIIACDSCDWEYEVRSTIERHARTDSERGQRKERTRLAMARRRAKEATSA